MSEDEARQVKANDEDSGDDVDAHGIKRPKANEEPGQDDDDVEAHVHRAK